MALNGNLHDFSLTQLLNLVSVARKTGLLVIENGSQHVQLNFVKGKLACARMGQAVSALLDVLESSRRISSAQGRLLRERGGGMSEKELGLMLVNAGYITQRQALDCLQTYYLELVGELFGWRAGQFRFENDQPPPEGAITLRIGLEDLVLDGARKQQEAQLLLEEIPNLEMALRFVERPGSDIQKLKLSKEEWRVLRYVNPKNTLRQIATTLKLTDLELRRTVYALLQASLIELVRPAVAGAAMPAPRVEPQTAFGRQSASALPRETSSASSSTFSVHRSQPTPALAGASGFVARPKPAPVAHSQPNRGERFSLITRLINRIKAL